MEHVCATDNLGAGWAARRGIGPGPGGFGSRHVWGGRRAGLECRQPRSVLRMMVGDELLLFFCGRVELWCDWEVGDCCEGGEGTWAGMRRGLFVVSRLEWGYHM